MTGIHWNVYAYAQLDIYTVTYIYTQHFDHPVFGFAGDFCRTNVLASFHHQWWTCREWEREYLASLDK